MTSWWKKIYKTDDNILIMINNFNSMKYFAASRDTFGYYMFKRRNEEIEKPRKTIGNVTWKI